MVYKKPKQQNL